MNAQTLGYIVAGSVLLGTVGGLLEKAPAGSFWQKLGVVLASLGTDLASLGKLGGGGAS